MSIDRWLDTRCGVYKHNGILLSHKKEQNNAICSNMDGTRDSHTEWSQSERERQNTICYHLYLECNMWHKLTFPQNRKSWTWRIDLWLPRGRGEGVGWIGSLGLIDANCCLWHGWAMRSCCVALGTMSSHLWQSMIMWENRMCTCMYNWVIMPYSRKNLVLGK